MDISKITHSDVVAELLKEGLAAADTAKKAVQNAAVVFVSNIKDACIKYTAEDIKLIVSHGKLLYKNELDGNHNMSAWFSDCVTLGLAPDADAVVAYTNMAGKEAEHTVSELLDADNGLSQNDVKKATTALRADLGIGRKAGGGRKARTPDTKSNVTKQIQGVSVASTLDSLLKSKTGIEQLNNMLKQHGYRLAKIRAKKAA